jgi:hypothetical protein
MTIHIIDEQPDIYLTREQYHRLMQEYQKAFQFYSGIVPTFEDWVRHGKTQVTLSNGTGQRT